MQRLTFLFIILLFLFACKSKQNDQIETKQAPVQQNLHKEKNLVERIFYNVPSPLEMAKITKNAGMVFNSELMNPVKNNQYYIDQITRALNFGIYGADLSYSRIFDQVQQSINYLSVIKELTDALQIPQHHGNFAIDKLEKHIDNRDSLLHIITNTYSDVDIYLKENNRGLIAVMIIAGGWIEGNYLAINSVNIESPNNEALKRIGEQKFSLRSLIKLLEAHVQNENKSYKVLSNLKKLQHIYKNVTIKTTSSGVETDTENRKTTLTGKTHINIDIETLKNIKKHVTTIRNEITEP